jgi:hypothetical protein
MIRYASDRDRHHRVLARDPAQVSVQSTLHLFPDYRLSSAGAEHQVNQTKYVTMRHENQPSLTGLVFLAPLYPALVRRCTFFLILRSVYAPNRTGLLSGRPYGTLRYQQLLQLGAGKQCSSCPNRLRVILPFIQASGKPGEM